MTTTGKDRFQCQLGTGTDQCHIHFNGLIAILVTTTGTNRYTHAGRHCWPLGGPNAHS